jgi:expansin
MQRIALIVLLVAGCHAVEEDVGTTDADPTSSSTTETLGSSSTTELEDETMTTESGSTSTTGETTYTSEVDATSDTSDPDDSDGGLACTTDEREGYATYYAADGSGNCSFPASSGDLRVAAINTADYQGSASCGGCVAIDGPLGSVVVRIVDRCPGCGAGGIDLSTSAFAEIANLSDGKVPITWRYVPCEVEGPIRYHYKSGSNEWWSAVQIRNHRHRIAKLEFLGPDGYQEVGRVDYNFFVQSGGMGPPPYSFRVTDVLGQSLEDADVPFVVGGERSGAAQFPACH